MPYMNCPRCGLSIRLRASYLAIERCPRCLVRRKMAVAMYLSERPGEPGADDPPADEVTPRAADEARSDC